MIKMKKWKTLAIMTVLTLVICSAVPATTAITQKSSKVRNYITLPNINEPAIKIATISASYTRTSDNEAIATVEFTKEPKDVIEIPRGISFGYIITYHVKDLREKPHSSYIVKTGNLPFLVTQNFEKIDFYSFPYYRYLKIKEFYLTISASISGPHGSANISKTVLIKIVPWSDLINDTLKSSSTIMSNIRANPSIISTTNPNIATTPREYESIPSITNPAVTTNPVISKLFETISEQINSHSNNVETTPSTTPNAQPNPSTTPNKDIQVEPSDIIDAVNETSAVSEEQEANCY